jgi:hypothetical protein
MAVNKALGTSTRGRFACARTLLPEHESIFRDRDAAHPAFGSRRIGIEQGTDGSELPPAVAQPPRPARLESGFRSILRLIEFTGDAPRFASA